MVQYPFNQPWQNPQRIRAHRRTAHQPYNDMADQRRIMLTHHRFECSTKCCDIRFLGSLICAGVQHRSGMENENQHGRGTRRKTGWAGRRVLVAAIDAVRRAKRRTTSTAFGRNPLEKRVAEDCVIWRNSRLSLAQTKKNMYLNRITSVRLSGWTVVFFGEQL